MNRRLFISELAVLSVGFTVQAQTAGKTIKPNILFILADDLGWMDLSCYGSSFYETPNIDQLAKEGIRFTNAYAACPVSSPTRTSFQTGKYPARLHLTDYIPGGYAVASRKRIIDATCPVLPVPFVQNLPLSELTIGEALKQEGQIINGRILTPQGWLKDGSVLICDGKILEVTNSDLAVIGATVIDARGMTIVPGFVSMHAHGGGGHDYTEATEEAFRTATTAHLKHGATGIFPTLSFSQCFCPAGNTAGRRRGYCLARLSPLHRPYRWGSRRWP